MSAVEKQVETSFSQPSQSSEFASKKRFGALMICSKGKDLKEMPYLQCTTAKNLRSLSRMASGSLASVRGDYYHCDVGRLIIRMGHLREGR
jgi:hypothetical protein